MSQSRTRKFFYGVTADLIGTIFVVIGGIVATPIILKFISGESYGFWMTILQILGLLSVIEMGTAIAVIRRVADPRIAENKNELSQLLTSSVLVQVCVAAIIFIVGFVLSGWLLVMFGIKEQNNLGVTLAFFVMLIWFAASIPLGLIPAVLTGRQEMGIANGISTATQLASTVGVIPLLALGIGLMAFPLAQIIAGLMGTVVAIFFVRRFTPPFQIHPRYLSRSELKYLFYFSGYSWIGKIAFLLLTSTDNIVIASTLGAASVTPFLLTGKLNGIFAPMFARLASSSLAGLSEMFALQDYERLRRLAFNSFRLCMRIAAFSATVVILFSETFVHLWVGSSYFAGIGLVLVFGLITFRDMIIRPVSVIIISSGDISTFVVITLIEAIAKVALSIFFVTILHLGFAGIALGQFIGTSLISFWYFPLKICELTKLSKRICLQEGFLQPFLQSLPSVLVLILMAFLVSKSLGWLWFVIVGGVGVLVNILTFDLQRILHSPEQSWLSRVKYAVDYYRV